jgi:4-hydroxymandelate oxidase
MTKSTPAANDPVNDSRRALLRFLAESPLLRLVPLTGTLALVPPRGPALANDAESLIASAAEAVNVFDFEDLIRHTMQPGHFAYMAQGSDDARTIEANQAAFAQIRLRPRRLTGVSNPDLSVQLAGVGYDSPILLAPCGAQRAFHPQGEAAVGRAARSRNALQILSTVSNFSIEDVAVARGGPVWYQLYPTDDWTDTRRMIARAEAADSRVLVFTVDLPARNLEQIARFRRERNAECLACHSADPLDGWREKPMFDGIDVAAMRMGISGLTWDYVDRLRDQVDLALYIKGIVTADDAERAIEHGVDGIIVSNHGGRAEESGWPTIEALPEVVAAVRGRVPVLVDSGFRRGTDIFKALALGADAVAIGRPYLWGLGAFGQEGVERVIDILTRELAIVMSQMGTPSIDEISAASLQI